MRITHLILPLLLLAQSILAQTAPPTADTPPEPRQLANAIAGGLRWLHEHQVKEGDGVGTWPAQKYQTAVASLAGLAFLANGYLPGEGEYGATVTRAKGFVQSSMGADGYLGARDQSMYVHAICTLFGLAYLGMAEQAEQDQELAEWCRRSVALIVEAQKVRKSPIERGGWRYNPYGNESDLSVTSWQLLTLRSARACGYEIEDAVFANALSYMNSAFVSDREQRGGFLYRPGFSKDPEPAVTGVALFIKSLLETEPDERAQQALAYLKDYPPTWGGPQYSGYFFFGAFYMTQGRFQLGGEAWRSYGPRLQRLLIEHQQGDGRWDFPADSRPQVREAGQAYATAMAVLILSLEQQYLPMYQRQQRLY
jgi:hypothetical protein